MRATHRLSVGGNLGTGSWLEILGRYLVAQKNEKTQIKKIIFPRFHQLDATRKLLAAVLEEGQGGKYLIQHSAGYAAMGRKSHDSFCIGGKGCLG